MSNIQIQKPKAIASSSSPAKHSIGAFARTAALATGLALVSSAALNAQVKQTLFPKDTSNPIVKFYHLHYPLDKKRMNQVPDSLEFLGEFEINISKYPYKDIKLNENISISIAEQKELPIYRFVENDKYVLFYAHPDVINEYQILPGRLYVFKKKISNEIPIKIINIFV